MTNIQPTPKMKRRLNIWVMIFLLAFTGAILFSMFRTSVTDSGKYQALANRNQFGSIAIHANRGSIYDSNGQILAQSATVFNIILDPQKFREKSADKLDMVADKLSELFGTDKAKLTEQTEVTGNGSHYQIVAKRVEKPDADKLIDFCNENKISGFNTEQDTRRYYPQGDLAASVIGFLDGDGNGQYGLEAYYDDYLAGVDGKIVSARDAFGSEMPYQYEKTYDAQDGNSLQLTLDMTLQHYLEKGLAEAIDVHKPANRTCGIIMNPKTGAILAMATAPGFDLNSPATITDANTAAQLAGLTGDEYTKLRAVAWETQWKNKAITELYYPGSVFKVVTGSSALEEKVIDLNTTFYCNGTENVAGTNFNCWSSKTHGSQNFVEAMTNSCNPAFIQIGQRLGVHLFSQYFLAFGFGEPTGIDLPGEAKVTLFYPENQMGLVELASSSFGQTNKITPIQMITAYAATINGGNLVKPYLVSKINDRNGNVIKTTQPTIKRQVISEETSAIMRSTLETVVNNKGGSNSYIKGHKIGGKSGTSEKQDEMNKRGGELYVSSYVGFAPADDPEFIMLVMVDEPTGGEYYGSKVAVPVVTEVMRQALPYLGYYPEYSEDELKELPFKIPTVEDQEIESAKNTLVAQQLKYEIIGSGTTVVKQVPSRGSDIVQNSTVVLYTDEDYTEESVTVPSLIGKNLSDVNKELTNLGLNMIVQTGNPKRQGAYVVKQNWPEGSEVVKGTTITLTFQSDDQY